jgi:Fe-S-cluster containining protein
MAKPLPCKECGGRCCRYAPIESKVWAKVKNKLPGEAEVTKYWPGTYKEAYVAIKPNSDGVCAFLIEGRCSIYSYRPDSCRAVGVRIVCSYVDPKGAIAQMAKWIPKGHKFISEGGA